MEEDEIFNAYIDDKCPCCGGYVCSDSYHGERTSGGKTMSLDFQCSKCGCVYIVGFGRSRMPIESEILASGIIN